MSKLTDKEWIELTNLTLNFYKRHESIRMGQSYMNALHKIKPKLYEEITATDNDCFYNDDLIINFMDFLNEK